MAVIVSGRVFRAPIYYVIFCCNILLEIWIINAENCQLVSPNA